jgi:hypothetical protein
MATMVGDLAILSAEKYDVGGRFASAARNAARKAVRHSSTASNDGAAARKRARPTTAEAPAADGEDRKGKRGRPRLETKDETAQDVSVACHRFAVAPIRI